MTLLKNQKGQGLTEYLILLLLISVVSIGAARALGKTIRKKVVETQKEINHMRVNDSGANRSPDDSADSDKDDGN